MKILHLNTYKDNGGAGKAAGRLNRALQQNDIDSELWVYFSFNQDKNIKTFSSGFIRRGLAAIGIILERIVAKIFLKPLKTPFSFPVSGTDISSHPAVQQADILHLHWVNHGFLRPSDISKIGKLNKPIVWTFHDSNAFTGGCHVRYSCNHFENECGNCPLLKYSNRNDGSHRIWKQKEKAYRNLDIHVIAPSNWMADSVRRSNLLGNRPVQTIPNTLNTSIFKPVVKAEAKKALGIAENKFVMLSGFMPSRNDLHKGTSYLLEALQLILEQIAKEKIELIVFGNRDEKNLPAFPVKVTFLGRIDDEQKLAQCYSAADIFLAPSLEDNLPYTVMESLACGTPVVAFTTGGIPDMVIHQVNGYLAKYRSAEDLAAGINWVYNHPEREILNINARKAVEERFSETIIAKQHIETYKKLLNIAVC